MTIDELYEAFMDEGKWGEEGLTGIPGMKYGPKPFAEDIYHFMDYDMAEKGWNPKDWAKEYGMYLPIFDPSGIKLAERERDIEYDKAMDVLNLTQKATDRVYTTELDTLSTELGREMSKGKAVAGRLGLRSGGLEGSIEDTIKVTQAKTKDLGDRLQISETETKDKYNAAMVDSALDYEKTQYAEKEEFYNRTMAAIMRLTDKGAFEETKTPREKVVDEVCGGYTGEAYRSCFDTIRDDYVFTSYDNQVDCEAAGCGWTRRKGCDC